VPVSFAHGSPSATIVPARRTFLSVPHCFHLAWTRVSPFFFALRWTFVGSHASSIDAWPSAIAMTPKAASGLPGSAPLVCTNRPSGQTGRAAAAIDAMASPRKSDRNVRIPPA
jgi:hypothetical protein